jgi:hypothetical protein
VSNEAGWLAYQVNNLKLLLDCSRCETFLREEITIPDDFGRVHQFVRRVGITLGLLEGQELGQTGHALPMISPEVAAWRHPVLQQSYHPRVITWPHTFPQIAAGVGWIIRFGLGCAKRLEYIIHACSPLPRY